MKEETKIEELSDFSIDAKRTIVDIITDCPSLVRLGNKEYTVKDMRYYSVYRISRLVLEMRAADEKLDTDNKVITALCTDLDAMCEILAIILCNHLFTADDIKDDVTADNAMSRNDRLIKTMKAKVLNSTFEINQWAAIILGAIKSIDLPSFFLTKKLVSMATDSMLTRKRKSVETVSQFMEAQSLQMPPTS